MKDARLNALITLVADWMGSLGVEERKQFIRELRCGWCERCGHTENETCRQGTCR